MCKGRQNSFSEKVREANIAQKLVMRLKTSKSLKEGKIFPGVKKDFLRIE